jgi:HK97 family phage prohead protease
MRIKGLTVIRSGLSVAPVARALPELRAGGEQAEQTSDLAQMFVRFSPFNTWYEINSWYEGRFLERTIPGAFKRTISAAKRDDGNYSVKSMFNHGMDFHIGDKLLGTVSTLAERDTTPEMFVDLYEEASYVRDLIPGLRAGDYGSSFMFEVLRDSWNHEPEASDYNPEGLPERTIEEVRLYEAGPVTFPASPTASSGLRSNTDWYIERLQDRDSTRAEGMVRSFTAFRSAFGLRLPGETPAPTLDAKSTRHAAEKAQRERKLLIANAKLSL